MDVSMLWGRSGNAQRRTSQGGHGIYVKILVFVAFMAGIVVSQFRAILPSPAVTLDNPGFAFRLPNGETNILAGMSNTERYLTETARLQNVVAQDTKILELQASISAMQQQLRNFTAPASSAETHGVEAVYRTNGQFHSMGSHKGRSFFHHDKFFSTPFITESERVGLPSKVWIELNDGHRTDYFDVKQDGAGFERSTGTDSVSLELEAVSGSPSPLYLVFGSQGGACVNGRTYASPREYTCDGDAGQNCNQQGLLDLDADECQSCSSGSIFITDWSHSRACHSLSSAFATVYFQWSSPSS